jgi:response regulator RpfG family c-di-GMP phosphodiesterase
MPESQIKKRQRMNGKPVILVVDDQPLNLELLEAFLIPQGYEIVTAVNGEDALGKLSVNQIDMILLDVMMPGMDGFEVTRRVRQDSSHRLLPIVLVTGLRDTKDRVKGIEAGCDDFISKPINTSELLARVRSLIKVKAYNDLLSNYQKDLESEVTRRSGELKHALENLQQEITERKHAEKALRERDRQFTKLSFWVPGMLYQFTKRPDGTYHMPFSTEAVKDLFGCSPQDVCEDFSPIARMILPEDFDKLIDSIEYSAKHMTVWSYAYRVQIPGQPIKWLFGKATPEKLADGSITWYGFNTDITERKQAADRIKKALEATVQAIAVTIEARDPYTAGHQRRVADLAHAIATEMNLPMDMMDGISMAAAIHDLGKISIPAEILSKPTKLTNIEFSLIKTHPQSGYDILKDIEFPWPIARTILDHHEKMNGSGYPNGLKGEDILMEARILSVADVVEAMASYRPYRPALGLDAALEEIEKNRGTLYDSTVVDSCLRLFREKGFQLERA